MILRGRDILGSLFIRGGGGKYVKFILGGAFLMQNLGGGGSPPFRGNNDDFRGGGVENHPMADGGGAIYLYLSATVCYTFTDFLCY